MRLRGDEQLLLHPGRMNGMAINAPNIIFYVFGTQKVSVLLIKLVASKATFGRIQPRQSSKPNDFFWIGRFRVRFARPMARFATLPLRTMAFIQHGLPVRALVVTSGLLFMAGLAGFRTNILGRICRANFFY